jgi:hypothetical protein
LLELDGASDRLHLFKADLLDEGSFDAAIDGCEGVFHAASPVIFTVTDPQVLSVNRMDGIVILASSQHRPDFGNYNLVPR